MLRTSVLACANPSGSRYNPRLSVIDNIHLPPTLLARFDLIYLILDKADEQTDRRLAKHIVAMHFENPELSEYSTGCRGPSYANCIHKLFFIPSYLMNLLKN